MVKQLLLAVFIAFVSACPNHCADTGYFHASCRYCPVPYMCNDWCLGNLAGFNEKEWHNWDEGITQKDYLCGTTSCGACPQCAKPSEPIAPESESQSSGPQISSQSDSSPPPRAVYLSVAGRQTFETQSVRSIEEGPIVSAVPYLSQAYGSLGSTSEHGPPGGQTSPMAGNGRRELRGRGRRGRRNRKDVTLEAGATRPPRDDKPRDSDDVIEESQSSGEETAVLGRRERRNRNDVTLEAGATRREGPIVSAVPYLSQAYDSLGSTSEQDSSGGQTSAKAGNGRRKQ